MLVCIDNHILVWGIRREATPGQEKMIKRTGLLLEYLEENDALIIIPSVVVGEFMVRVPPDKHKKVLAVLEKRFQIAPYDTAAALIAAQLWIEKNKGSSRVSDDLREGLKDPSRIKLKDDCKIIATAIKCKADCIYSEDDGVQKFGQGKIEVRDVPKYLMKQAELFDSQAPKKLEVDVES